MVVGVFLELRYIINLVILAQSFKNVFCWKITIKKKFSLLFYLLESFLPNSTTIPEPRTVNNGIFKEKEKKGNKVYEQRHID